MTVDSGQLTVDSGVRERTRGEMIKDIISAELTHFLLSEHGVPTEIQINVYYRESMARLIIDGNRFLGLKGADKI